MRSDGHLPRVCLSFCARRCSQTVELHRLLRGKLRTTATPTACATIAAASDFLFRLRFLPAGGTDNDWHQQAASNYWPAWGDLDLYMGSSGSPSHNGFCQQGHTYAGSPTRHAGAGAAGPPPTWRPPEGRRDAEREECRRRRWTHPARSRTDPRLDRVLFVSSSFAPLAAVRSLGARELSQEAPSVALYPHSESKASTPRQPHCPESACVSAVCRRTAGRRGRGGTRF